MQENLNAYSDKDRENFDRIFGKKEPVKVEPCPNCGSDPCICIS